MRILKDDEIPEEELIGEAGVDGRIIRPATLEEIFLFVITTKVQPHPTISTIDEARIYDYDRSYLLQEFMKWDQGRQEEYR